MKKLKILLIIVIVLVLGFGACVAVDTFLEDDYEDEYYGDDYYGDGREESVNNGDGISSVELSGMDAEAKDALIKSGAIREPQVKLKGDGTDTVTVLVYMNGSNLETEDSEATSDLSEMVEAGSSKNVKVVVQTMGTKTWDDKYGIASDHTQRYTVSKKGLKLVRDDLEQLDCTKANTLSKFIKWGVKKYPADRYILLFWDHGGGPVYGFGYDDNADSEDSMSIAAMRKGIADSGVYFDMIGMDCCIMSSMEVCCSLYDYCDYMVLSEDFESGLGWHYTTWLKALYENSSIPSTELGKIICDSMVQANEDDKKSGDKSIMAVVDEAMMKVLYTAWTDFAYANEDKLLGTNYSTEVKRKRGGRIHPRLGKRLFSDFDFSFENEEDPQMADYFVTDIMAVAENISSKESDALASAVAQTLVYVSTSSGEVGLTGMSVTLPYGDNDFYQELKTTFASAGIDEKYIGWLEGFTRVSQNTESYDYDDWYDDWDWDTYEDDYNWDSWDYYDDDEYWDDSMWWVDWLFEDDYDYYEEY